MPNYYNPYNFYPATYQSPMGYQQPQQSFASPQQGPKMMEWVEGEVGAKAFQMPNGWPANSPIPLWDSTDTVIWLKSWGPMGIPNPLQKLKYEMPEQQNHALLTAGQNGNMSGVSGNQYDMSQYVTKDDLNQVRQEIRNMMAQQNALGNQNGSNNGRTGQQNRGDQK